MCSSGTSSSLTNASRWEVTVIGTIIGTPIGAVIVFFLAIAIFNADLRAAATDALGSLIFGPVLCYLFYKCFGH